MPTWSPKQYLKFADHRLRPARDLLARVDLAAPSLVCDLGCGTGPATALLAQRWPEATVLGVDSSADMLGAARRVRGDIDWIKADLSRWSPPRPADLLYSNAALHWLDHHETLFPGLVAGLHAGGVLAVQMPRNFDEPSHVCMAEAAAAGPWRDRLFPHMRPTPVSAPAVYYDLIKPHVRALDMWETVYMHVLAGENPVVEWTKGSALRPFLEALDDADRDAFVAEYAKRVRTAYPKRPDGTTLFPFRRLFMVARK